jgi:hypothetical protein
MTFMGDGGKLITKTKAYLKGYSDVWFNEGAITNILSLKNVVKKRGFHLSYNSVGDKGFAIHKANGKIIHFRMHPDGLHYHDFTNPEVSFLQIVKENEQGYSQRQLEQARMARDIYTKVGHPSPQDFKAMVAGGMILNCPITGADCDWGRQDLRSKYCRIKGQDSETLTSAGHYRSSRERSQSISSKLM